MCELLDQLHLTFNLSLNFNKYSRILFQFHSDFIRTYDEICPILFIENAGLFLQIFELKNSPTVVNKIETDAKRDITDGTKHNHQYSTVTTSYQMSNVYLSRRFTRCSGER